MSAASLEAALRAYAPYLSIPSLITPDWLWENRITFGCLLQACLEEGWRPASEHPATWAAEHLNLDLETLAEAQRSEPAIPDSSGA